MVLKKAALVILTVLLGASGCSVNVGLRKTESLEEVVLSQEDGREKILVLTIDGMISLEPMGNFLSKEPSMVSTLREQLDLARKDKRIKAVIVRINSPGGTLGATQMIHDELQRFRRDTQIHVLALYMEVAASGALYLSMASDEIMAYPSAVTGSMGVLFISPNFQDLGKKVGIEYRVVKTGSRKDMGTPFRAWPAEEQKLLTDLANGYGAQFKQVVFESRKARGMGEKEIETLSDARILSAEEALKLKLIDGIGTWSATIERLEKKFGQGKMKVVAYTRYPDEVRTLYSRTYGLASPMPAFGSSGASAIAAAGSVLEALAQGASVERPLAKGFYYLW